MACYKSWTAFVRLPQEIPGLKIEKLIKFCKFTVGSYWCDEIKVVPKDVNWRQNTSNSDNEVNLLLNSLPNGIQIQIHFHDHLNIAPLNMSIPIFSQSQEKF